jgi:glucuronosyltransferase
MEKLFQEKLGLTDRPSLVQLNADTSLILMNTFHSTHYARQYPANIVQIGGMHIAGKTKLLPPEISNFLNGSEFVYVSFGTAVRVSKSDSALQNKFFNALGNMTSFKFLWKWDGASLPTNTPGNIYFAKWLPQQDLYAHEKIRGMIGHGGINGIHEAVYYGVPMILFPFFADQDLNVNIMAKKGLGIKLEITDFTQQDLEQALEEIITNSRYKRNLVEASRVFNDRPVSPSETALWWTEYVLRNKGSKPLKSLSSDQSWYERRLLDVWLFIFLCAQASLIIAALISYQLYKLVRPRFQKSYTIAVKKAQ